MQQITVSVGAGYRVLIGGGLLRECGSLLAARLNPCRVLIVTDHTVGPLYEAQLRESLSGAGFSVDSFTFLAGEERKSMETLSALLSFLARMEFDRQDCILALGGGVVGDLAGFAAGVYQRGIRFVQLPTTLLAAVDASVGGKTAVNLPEGKNLAGLFHQPAGVLCDTDCLQTLPPETFAAGAAEAVKTAVLSGEELFSLLERGGLETEPEAVIAACVEYKARIVELDPRERGPRTALNLGHTFGHAVERCSGYQIPHGQAVAIGLAISMRAAARLGHCDMESARRVLRLLKALSLPTVTEFSPELLVQEALHDKKRQGDSLTFVLPAGIGKHLVRTLPLGGLFALAEAGWQEWEGL